MWIRSICAGALCGSLRNSSYRLRTKQRGRMLLHMPRFVGSKSVFSGNMIGICPQLSVGGVGHRMTVGRAGLLNGIVQKKLESRSFGGGRTTLTVLSVLAFQIRHCRHHLNRVHLEIALQSVCCVDPSLDVYFNSVCSVLSIIISAKLLKNLEKSVTKMRFACYLLTELMFFIILFL